MVFPKEATEKLSIEAWSLFMVHLLYGYSMPGLVELPNDLERITDGMEPVEPDSPRACSCNRHTPGNGDVLTGEIDLG